LLGQLQIQPSDLNPEHHFCLRFIDGLSKREESTISMLGAELGGSAADGLNAEVFSKHPLIYEHQQECYVRSISQVGENNALIFYSAIKEGMILNLCSHQDMVASCFSD